MGEKWERGMKKIEEKKKDRVKKAKWERRVRRVRWEKKKGGVKMET